MKQASIRDLRYDFPRLERLLQQGEVVEITRRRRVIARLTPERQAHPQLPDFLERLHAAYGEQVLATTAAELLAEDRGRL